MKSPKERFARLKDKHEKDDYPHVPETNETSKDKNGTFKDKNGTPKDKAGRKKDKEGKDKGSKKWVHPAEALLRGHIVYNTKFLGHVEVSEPKGSEVIKEAIRKMKFNKQLKKAEGQKPPKVELTISVDGVTVQEPKYKVIQHQYPLHRISYCADDKNDKRIFTFIAKDPDSNQHRCFVFDSDKCAEEITLTIGQAFDLAYKKFLDSSKGDMDTRKQTLLLHKKVQQLTQENLTLKERVANLERLVEPGMLEQLDRQANNDKSPTTCSSPNSPLDDDCSSPTTKLVQSDSTPFFRSLQFHIPLIPLPKPGKTRSSPRHTAKKTEEGSYDQMPLVQSPPAVDLLGSEAPEVGTKLENLVFEDNFVVDSNINGTSNGTNGTNGYAHLPPTQAAPVLAPPPPVPPRQNSVTSPQPNKQDVDLFGAEPFSPSKPPPVPSRDAFGMDSFNPGDLDKQIQKVDRELMDLQAGFSQGLSFGPDDFTLADLDPLNKK